MKPRAFINRMEIYHRLWLGNLLGMNASTSGGIDLYDNDSGIEIKCRYKKNSPIFTVHEYQIERFQKESPEKELFWAFLFYDLKKIPEKINKKSRLRNIVHDKEIWFFQWDYVKQFETHYPRTGPYKYINKKNFPESEHNRLEKDNCTFYLPKNMSKSLETRLMN